MYELLWFFGGALLYKLLAKLLRLYQLFAFFQDVQLQVLAMLKAASKDISTAIEIKHELLKTTDMSLEDQEQLKQLDDVTHAVWKEASIAHLIKCVPTPFKSTIKFNSWNDSVKYFNEMTQNRASTPAPHNNDK
jgi:hypothetical protein